MNPIRLICASFLIFGLLATLPAASRTLDEIRGRGQLDIGVALFTPWVLIRNDGRPAGFEIEVGARVALDMGVTPAFHLYDWDELIPALEANEIDVIIAGMTITQQRARRVLFTVPYSETGVDVAINDEVAGKFDRIEALNKPGIRVGVVRHTLAEQVAREQLPQTLRIPFFTSERLLDALEDGTIDAYLGAEPGPRIAAALHPARIEAPFEAPVLMTRQGMAVRKGGQELLTDLNQWIKTHRASGWLDQVAKYWFDSLGWHRKK